ncbi:hypothetical protein DPMN_115244 [Dreissena polymorpha]|uniref:Uncharacterized protein n=1 Tax=Dreissena polymorpha TaxID=45954 RepID=A0A9D4KLI3_DREPO|nr:hypothetical protein DPMN_115244 [Dreissena polymorpha]
MYQIIINGSMMISLPLSPSLPSCTLYGRLGGKVYPTHLLPFRALMHIVIPSCTPPFTLFCPYHVCSLSHHASVKGVSVPKDLLRQN